MLILSRMKSESVMVGDNVEIFIVDVRGDKVRLGINAPSDVEVHRREIWDKIQSQKESKDASETDEAA